MDGQYVFIETDNYVSLSPGDDIRLLPIGEIHRNGETRVITRELLEGFNLPHFKPPIKLGSHADATPSGGNIGGLEVREDGLYATDIELTPKGVAAIEGGDYRYHSPEVIWEDAGVGIEDASTGEVTNSSLIMGVALTHSPALGEQAALYEYRAITEDNDMPEGTQEAQVSVPASLFSNLFNRGGNQTDTLDTSQFEATPVEETEEYMAVQKERDDLQARIDTLEAAGKQAELYASIRSEFQGDEAEAFGFSFIELGEAEDTTEMLASMSEEQRTWVLTHFKAMSAQIDEAGGINRERGNELGGTEQSDDPKVALNQAVEAYQAEHEGTDYNAALLAVSNAQPELAQAALGGN